MARKNKYITIVGYYGYDNLGDDLMLDCLLNKINNRYPKIKVKLLAKWSENLQKITEQHKNVEYIYFKPKSKFYNFWTYLKTILLSDLTIWGGGTCFSDEDGIGNYKYFMLNYFLAKKFAYLGIGIGNISKKESISKTRFLFNKMAFASFRDEKSYLQAKALSTNQNLYLTGDLSFLFDFEPNEVARNKNETDKYVLVGLRDLSQYYSPKEIEIRHEAITTFLIELALEQNLKLLFLPIDSNKDKKVNQMVANKINERNSAVMVELVNNTGYAEKIKLISGAEFNFTERLHSIVMSKFLDVPCLAISYSPKIDRFFTEIEDDGFISYQEGLSVIKLRELGDRINKNNTNSINVEVKNRLKINAFKNVEIIGKYL